MGLWERVVFLDRDDVVNEGRYHESGDRRNYVTTWDEFIWIPGSREAIVKLLENDYFVVVVSNQACVGKHLITPGGAKYIMCKMKNDIRAIFPPERGKYRDRRIENLDYFICPHTGEEENECTCRKPSPGMIYAAAYKHNLYLKHAWMAGDRTEDLKAGWAAGIRKLVRIKKGQEVKMPEHKWQWKRNTLDGIPFPDLKSAVDFIMEWDAPS